MHAQKTKLLMFCFFKKQIISTHLINFVKINGRQFYWRIKVHLVEAAQELK